MSFGYVGQRSRRRKRYLLLFFFLMLLVGVIFVFVNSIENIDSELVENERPSSQKNDNISINKLEIKLFEAKQKIILRENLVSSLKKQINSLEENNNELVKAIRLLNLKNNQNNLKSQKLQINNLDEIKQLQETIDKLNKDIDNLNKEIKINLNSYSFLKNENNRIQNLAGILENNNNTLEIQKDIAFQKIEDLKKRVIEQDKLIKEMKDKIHH